MNKSMIKQVATFAIGTVAGAVLLGFARKYAPALFA